MTNQGDPVLVTTKHRGVFFGYFESIKDTTVVLTKARNCIRWSEETKGFLGLASTGPRGDGTRVGPSVSRLELYDVTAIVEVSAAAVERWETQPWT